MAFGTNHDAVADHALALMLAAAHRIVEYDRRVRARRLGHACCTAGCTRPRPAIVGFGRIGRAVAKRCLGFNMEVLVADPVAEADTVARLGYRLVELDELLRAGRLRLRPRAAHRRDPPPDRRAAAGADEAHGHPDQHRARRPGRRGGVGPGAGRRSGSPGRRSTCSRSSRCPTRPLRRHRAGGADPARGRPQRRIAAAPWPNAAVENILAVLRGRDPGPGLVLNPEVLPSHRT